MPLLPKRSPQSVPWFGLGVSTVLLLAVSLHFWGLSRFNTLVFDEVYFAKFARNYLTWTPFFDGHPPLGKYLIAVGIWLGHHLPWSATAPQNDLTGSPLAPLSYRWVNALTGSLLPVVVMALAYQLTHRRRYTFLAGLLITVNGLLLVESRYALINVYLILFGLLGQWCFLLALRETTQSPGANLAKPRVQIRWLLGSGIWFGAAIAVKWNGLWFLLGAYGLWFVAWIRRLTQQWWIPSKPVERDADQLWDVPGAVPRSPDPWTRLTQINLFVLLLAWAVIPFGVYSLSWIPHLQLNPEFSFWEIQRQILTYHQQLGGNTPDVHPYCSPWYTWPWMIRPIAYFYEVLPQSPTAAIPLALQGTAQTPGIYDVHAMGNPGLWWLSTLAVLGLGVWLVQYFLQPQPTTQTRFTNGEGTRSRSGLSEWLPAYNANHLWIAAYLLIQYAANFLPWVPVTRCAFLYHYMSASIFASLGLAWFIDHWLNSSRSEVRGVGLALLLLIGLSFWFWLPLFLGLPLSPEAFQARRWLPTW